MDTTCPICGKTYIERGVCPKCRSSAAQQASCRIFAEVRDLLRERLPEPNSAPVETDPREDPPVGGEGWIICYRDLLLGDISSADVETEMGREFVRQHIIACDTLLEDFDELVKSEKGGWSNYRSMARSWNDARAEIARLRSEVERLTRERDDLQAKVRDYASDRCAAALTGEPGQPGDLVTDCSRGVVKKWGAGVESGDASDES